MATEELRTELVDSLRHRGALTDPRVAEAFRTVPRDRFVPEVPVERAYRDDKVVIKRDDSGRVLSSASAPWLVSSMLEQLDVQPGQRVLEIGAGTGYNAALLAHLVGPAGEVVTVDIDQDVADRAAHALQAAGCRNARVVCADGGLGVPERAPYDRVLATVGMSDLSAAWLEQIDPTGRLVVPLMLGGPQRSIAFLRSDLGSVPRWTSDSVVDCGFVGMRGVAARSDQRIELGAADAFVQIDTALDSHSLRPVEIGNALAQQAYERPTGVRLGQGESYIECELWIPLTEPDACRLVATGDAVERPLADWGTERMSIALAREGSVAYLSRGAGDPYGIDVRGHGDDGPALADRLAAALRAWDRAGRPGTPGLRVDAYPKGTPDQLLGTPYVLDREHTRLAISWRAS